MDRADWIKETRREAEERYDTLWAPLYDEKWGLYPNTTHQQFIQKFLRLLPQHSKILDAACGAGRYLSMLLEHGHTVVGIDQSQGMLSRAQAKFPNAQVEKVGLQEMLYHEVFDGVICMDAMEHVFPEDWPLVLSNFHRALKPQGYLYFTVEIADESEIEQAFIRGQHLGLPVVYGEWADEDVYHYYPSMQQVREWTQQAGFGLVEEGEGDGYHHFVIRKASKETMTFSQSEFDVRCEWGEHGVSQLAPISDVIIIVDVLSFSTSVEIATSRGAMIFPYRWKDASAAVFAASVGAIVADARRGSAGYSLSPQSLVHLAHGTRLVLPSPNGATLTLGTGMTPALAGCLRNAQAVAAIAQRYGQRIAVIPAGERWPRDGSLRPAVEDWVGAGAIISHLAGTLSPEAHAAATTFRGVQSALAGLLQACGSGKELLARGFASDVALASALNVSECVPVFRDGAYVQWGSGSN